MRSITSLPEQAISFNKKGKTWRKKCVDACDSQTYSDNSGIRKSILNKRILFDLWNGKLHMEDMRTVMAPHMLFFEEDLDEIQHYPIASSHIKVLLGEEYHRKLDFTIGVTNKLAISEVEKRKNEDAEAKLLNILSEDYGNNPELIDKKLKEYQEFYQYNYQDKREKRDNYLLKHYVKELNIKDLLDEGYLDLLVVGEEAYMQDIVDNEPVVFKLNNQKLNVIQNGNSKFIEDADIVVYKDHWSPGAIQDYFHDELTLADVKKLEKLSPWQSTDSMDNETPAIMMVNDNGELIEDDFIGNRFDNTIDNFGNIRVVWTFWKSRRKVLRVKYYDEFGRPQEDYFPENYIVNKDAGEEFTVEYINEAWEGVKIADDIYVRMGPRKIQYNRLSNPSICHFGITGIISSSNEMKSTSLFEMTKPYQYLYDVIHARINDALAHDFGSIMELDYAKIPKGWEIEKWLYFAIKNKIAVTDSFKAANEGPATGKLAGYFNTTGKPLNFSQGNYIEYNIKLLEAIKLEMSEVTGITRQRLGSTQTSETVGGIERSVKQSTYSTEYYVRLHDMAKRKFMITFLETLKIALKGNKKKYSYIGDDGTRVIFDVDGDELAETDHGFYFEDSIEREMMEQKMDQLLHAAMQNQAITTSSVIKFYNASSMIEKQKIVEKSEQETIERAQQQSEAENKIKQEEINKKDALENRKIDVEEQSNIRDNETKVKIKMMELLGKEIEGVDEDGIASVDTIAEEAKLPDSKLNEFIKKYDIKTK